ncbi:MAG TPA: homoprotocatechuate degradation operon regulator HpaR [Proteus sp.]|uniref:Homoprotocatechuate degradative operon repressor n=1 Tax=Proteus hauseri ATCC 700826 TaxID=1354271 RepID=A0AAJ3HUH7_PROHU|nr:homoprotocatechuate degradation operon regulator HpaR [Proteus hauseri]OAT48693.1 homoprotocatechuate degradative operon repressor [Proteus hauseri ATCC 700826]HCH51047.1 homoprotocatechuate degradation operon regulator HpaR [Proteus sp. (in: enterobacteria)]
MHESLTIALLQARESAMGFFRPVLKEHNLTEQQWRIIRVLADKRSIDFHELAQKACILRPSLTGILIRMERDELICRLKPVSDQRKLFVSLSVNGQNLYDKIQPKIDEGYQLLEQKFSTEKLQSLSGLLKELIALNAENTDISEK